MMNVNRGRLIEPSEAPASAAPVAPAIAPPMQLGTPSQFFQCPLPAVAAGYDQYERQFYGRHGLPLSRIFLPS